MVINSWVIDTFSNSSKEIITNVVPHSHDPIIPLIKGDEGVFEKAIG